MVPSLGSGVEVALGLPRQRHEITGPQNPALPSPFPVRPNRPHTAPSLRCGGFLAVATLVAFAACDRPPMPSQIGVSSGRAADPPVGPRTGEMAAQWERMGEVSGYSLVSGGRFPSRGHFVDRWEAEILANPTGAPSYANAVEHASTGGAPTGGSVFVSRHYDARSGQPGPLFIMVRREPGPDAPAGDWEYLVTTPDGAIESRGPLPLCARCHAEAGPSHLFPPPKP